MTLPTNLYRYLNDRDLAIARYARYAAWAFEARERKWNDLARKYAKLARKQYALYLQCAAG